MASSSSSFSFVEPMKALPVTDLPVGNWLYEMKFDGYRALAFKAGKEVRLISRNRTNFDNDYPPLIDALKSLGTKQAILDGEIAALDVHWSRVIKETPSSITITKDSAGRYFVTLTIEESRDTLPENTVSVGIDLGGKTLA